MLDLGVCNVFNLIRVIKIFFFFYDFQVIFFLGRDFVYIFIKLLICGY